MKNSVAVVIPTHKRPTYLRRAIDSVLQQTAPGCEIVVVDDNGEGDDFQIETAGLMQEYQHRPDVHYVVHPVNKGGSSARNTGLRFLETEFVAFLDDDDEWLPDFVEKHLQVFESSEADVVYCNCERVYEGSSVRDARLPVNYRGKVFSHLLTGWCPSSTSLFMIRRTGIPGNGPFDEQFASYQDYDCWLGLAQSCQFDYCDDVLMVKHSHGTDQISRNPQTRRKGLNTLKKKWVPRLDSAQLAVFQVTLKQFEKELLRQEFLLIRRSAGVLKSLRNALKYINYCNFNLRDTALILRNLVFPYR